MVDAPVSIAKAQDPAQAARSTPDASIVLAAKAVAQGRAQALVCAGGTGAALAAGIFNIKRAHGIYRPALAIPLPVPERPVTLLDVGANAEARREHIVQFAFMGAALSSAVMGVARPRVGLLSNGEESQRGSELVLEAHAELSERMGSSRRLRVRRQRRGRRPGRGGRRRDRHRRVHGEHRAEADGGRLAADARRDPPGRDVIDAGQDRRGAAAARRCARSATRSTPRPAAAHTCSGCAAWASFRTGASRARASPRRSSAPSAAPARTSSARPTRALEQAGALRRSPASAAGASLPQSG